MVNFSYVSYLINVARGHPGEEDEEGHDVDVPESLESQEHGTAEQKGVKSCSLGLS